MSKKNGNPKSGSQKNSNHKANQSNANKGTKGTNKVYDKNQGNRGQQLNPNQQPKKGA